MFQFEAAGPSQRVTPVAAPPVSGQELSHRALLAWAEHCIECAPPACYASCDLFVATPALKCRRFDDGLVANHTAGAIAAEVRFGKWAKLETQGNARMLRRETVDWYEAALVRLGKPVAWLGALAYRLGAGKRWLTAGETLHKRINRRLEQDRGRSLRANVFVAEITNPGADPVPLMLTCSVDKLRMARSLTADQLPPPAILSVVAPSGFSRQVLDAEPMRLVLDSGLPFNLAISPQDDARAHLIFHKLDLGVLADREQVEAASGGQAPVSAAKLVIFDLDNTLWEGVLLEGPVSLRPGVRELFQELDERGVLISIASKNAPQDALARLTEAGLTDYLLYPQIGWHPKSESVARIIKAIDIGADAVMFVDDNSFERSEVATAVPGVDVLPESAVADLARHPRLQGAATPEARGRRRMYQEAIARNDAASTFGDDYLQFLRSCDITVAIRPDRAEDFDRIAELVQRTNQLNFSGRKYSRDDTALILANPAQERHVLTCADRFGNYGTVGFCLAHREAGGNGRDILVIDDFMLSCRVQGKFVEQALLNHLAENGPHPVGAIRVNFRPTDRNKASQMVLKKLGFVPDDQAGGYGRDFETGALHVDFMTITTE